MLVATLSVLKLIVELSCARTTVYFDSKPGTAPVLRVSLAGAQHLVDQALVGTPPARATHAAPPTAASRSQLLQLRSELDAAQAVAASDLDTQSSSRRFAVVSLRPSALQTLSWPSGRRLSLRVTFPIWSPSIARRFSS